MVIIINADDLGASQKVNDAIFSLMDQELVSSATMIANAPFIKDAAARAKSYHGCSFGIHLNITSFSPITQCSDLSPILDNKSNFIEKDLLQKVSMTRALANAILMEFCSQADKLISLGIDISHIDSHQHIHTIPKIYPTLKRFQRKYGIKKARITQNIYLTEYNISKLLLLKKMLYNLLLRNNYTTKTTSGFGNLTEFYNNAETNLLKHNTVEIMVHPGSDNHKEENSILKPFWHKSLPVKIELVNYHQL